MIVAAGIFRTIILLGAIQGFIVSSLLFFSKKTGPSNRLLATLIFLIALACINLCATEGNWYGTSLILQLLSAIVPMVIIMPAGPLIYFYVQSSLNPAFVLTPKQRLHFYPVIIDLVPQLIALVVIAGVLTGLLKGNQPGAGRFIDTYNVYADIPRWISVTFYLWLSVRYMASRKDSARVGWLRQFIRVFLAFQALWLVYLVPYVIPRYTGAVLNALDWYPIYVPLAIIVYWLGIKGFMIAQAQPTDSGAGVGLSPGQASGSGSGSGSGSVSAALPEATVRQAILLLNKAMKEDKVYLDPGLNLQVLAGHTDLAPKIISAVLNQHMHKSFNEFLNEYRIEAFKEKVRQPQMDHLTIVGIAFECGFNSQATFQRVFKEVTGQSPSAFRKSAESNAQIRI